MNRRLTETQQGGEQQTDARTKKHAPRWMVATLFLVILFVIIIVLIIDIHPKQSNQKKVGGQTLGGAAAELAATTFIDANAPFVIRDTMTLLTTGCSPPTFPIVDPIYNTLLLGSRASTTASWQGLKTYLSTSPLKCFFPGLEEMEILAGFVAEGPLDICYAYTSATLQFIQIYYGNTTTLPPQFYSQLILGVSLAFPLNLYWSTSSFSYNEIASDALSVATTFVSANGNKNVATLASQFCNKYFGQDNLNQYSSLFQPLLAFPFPTLTTRISNNTIQSNMKNILAPLTQLLSVPIDVKHVYVFNDVILDYPGADLFVQSVLGGISYTLESGEVESTISSILEYIYDGTSLLNTSKAPVVIMAEYVDAYSYFNSLKLQPNSIIFVFTYAGAQAVLPFNAATTLQSAQSFQQMNIFDFETVYGYEVPMGSSFIEEKHVSDIINSIFSSYVTIGTSYTELLLDTFAISNTIINGVDIGGRVTAIQTQQAMDASGVSTGMVPHAFSMSLTQAVFNASENSDILLGSGGGVVGSTTPLPPAKSVDWRGKSPSCISPVVNQGRCQNCWAIASSSQVSAQLCIDGVVTALNQLLSQQHVTSCSQLSRGTDGCSTGQYPDTGYTFMLGDVHTQQCMPQIDTATTEIGCLLQCTAGSGGSLSTVNGIVSNSYLHFDNPTDIKTYLTNVGPIATAFNIPNDFQAFFPLNTFNDGIYRAADFTTFIGGHMVLMVGYDDSDPNPLNHYWIIKNSWGTGQGMNGYLKIQQNLKNFNQITTWFDTNGWMAKPRKGSVAPLTVINQVSVTIDPNIPPVAPVVYTTSVNCPQQVLNGHQANVTSTIQGCPNSATNVVRALRGHGGHGSTNVPNVFIVSCVIIIAVVLAFM